MNHKQILILAAALLLAWPLHRASAAQNKTIASYDTSGTAYDVVVANGYAYIADGTSGVVILSVANPASPAYVTTYDTPGPPVRSRLAAIICMSLIPRPWPSSILLTQPSRL